MKLDITHMKKVASDGNTTTLRHPKGHEIRIAHNALSKDMKAKLADLPHYADGGEVSDPALNSFIDAGTPQVSSVDAGADSPAPDFAAQAASSAPSASPVPTAAPGAIQGEVGPSGSPTPAPASVDPNAIVNPQAGLTGTLQKAIGETKAGDALEQQAASAQGKAESGIYGQLQSDLAAKSAKDEAANAGVLQHHQELMKAVQDGQIQPNHYLGNMSTLGKVGTAVGLILSGLGAGGSGQPNLAADFLQKSIQNDIESQKENLGKKQSLLSANLQLFHDMKDAQAATTANMMGIASMKLKQEAAKAMDPQARARALQQAGALDAQYGPQLAQLDFKQKLLSQAGGQMDPAKLVSTLVPEAHQKDVFKEIGQSQAANSNEAPLMDNFDKASKDVRLDGDGHLLDGHPLYSTFVTPPSIKSLNALVDPLIHDNEGRINELEQKHVQGLFPQAWDSDETVAAKKSALQEFINHKKDAPTAKGFGIDLNKFQSTSSDPVTKLDPQKQQWVAWAQQNPNDPRAQVLMKKLGVK